MKPPQPDKPDRTAQLAAVLLPKPKPGHHPDAARIVAAWQRLRAQGNAFEALRRLDERLRKRGVPSDRHAQARAEILYTDEDGKPVTAWGEFSETWDEEAAALTDRATTALLKGNAAFFAALAAELRKAERARARFEATENDTTPDRLTVAILRAAQKGPVNLCAIVRDLFGDWKTNPDHDNQRRKAARIARRFKVSTIGAGRPRKY